MILIATALAVIFPACFVNAICNEDEEKAENSKVKALSLFGAIIFISLCVVSATGCPEFVADEYARVLMARNTADNPDERLEALSIYKTDETGKATAD